MNGMLIQTAATPGTYLNALRLANPSHPCTNVIPEEQAAILTIKEPRAGGMSLRRIAEEIRARYGMKPSHMTVQAVVRP